MLVTRGAKQENLQQMAIAEAAGQGAQLVLLPETLDLGWTHPSAKEQAEAIPGGEPYEQLSTAAERAWRFRIRGAYRTRANAGLQLGRVDRRLGSAIAQTSQAERIGDRPRVLRAGRPPECSADATGGYRSDDMRRWLRLRSGIESFLVLYGGRYHTFAKRGRGLRRMTISQIPTDPFGEMPTFQSLAIIQCGSRRPVALGP